jgi:transposase InsO family protein
MYNTERPHWSLNGQTPEQVFNSYIVNLTKVCQMS